MQRQIFRQVALERLSSPEQLDQLIPITSSRGWLALAGLIAIIIAALVWSFVARLPTQVAGQGLLLRGGPAEAGAPVLRREDAGQPLEAVIYLPIAVGKTVQPGMVALISPTHSNREAAGAVRGVVRSVSALPATLESAASVLGDAQLARVYLADGTMLEVHVGLDGDAANAGQSPISLTSGTPCSVLITLAERRPIDLLIN